jgi:phosphoribosylaminoimidazolecarboxamide formyltransferase/IMP cyclohydrolase
MIAPGYDQEAFEMLKKRNMRIMTINGIPPRHTATLEFRRVSGSGFIVQTTDCTADDIPMKTMSKREPTKQEIENLIFAWRAVKLVKSNAIVLTKDNQLLGMGAGQPSRVDSVAIAIKKAGDRARGSVLGSDAFFPFPDGVELAGEAGITAIIQPGGSKNDDKAIEAANKYNIAMVFTGMRHFRH